MFQTITKTGPHVYVTHKIDFIKLDYEKKIENLINNWNSLENVLFPYRRILFPKAHNNLK